MLCCFSVHCCCFSKDTFLLNVFLFSQWGISWLNEVSIIEWSGGIDSAQVNTFSQSTHTLTVRHLAHVQSIIPTLTESSVLPCIHAGECVYLKGWDLLWKQVAAGCPHSDVASCQVIDLHEIAPLRCRVHHCFLSDSERDAIREQPFRELLVIP